MTEDEMSRIDPRDYAWLNFLFYLDATDRWAGYDWNDGLYAAAIWGKIKTYAFGYPIMFIWQGCRKLRGRE